MKKILLLLCLLLCACSAQTDIKTIHLFKKRRSLLVVRQKGGRFFFFYIQYSKKGWKNQTITLFTKK